jgi:4-carboxymuconolactone decarboxylase
MKPTTPRIPPLDPSQFTDEQAALTDGRDSPRSALNIVRTLVNHPALFRSWTPFAMHLIATNSSTLTAREREILILRTCGVCESTYDVAQHTVIARRAGLTDTEISSVLRDGAGLSSFERTLLKAADELVRERCITDATWTALAERYTHQQLMDLVFTVGNYTMLSMATNTFGVPVESNVELGWKPN